jgi:hypothetical protein
MSSTSPFSQPPLTLLFTQSFCNVPSGEDTGRCRDGRPTRYVHRFSALSPLISSMCILGVYAGWPHSASNQPLQAGSNFGNGSGPLFSIYSNIAEKEDNKMADRWQRDAQGILIFVSLHVSFRTPPTRQLENSRLVCSLSSSRYSSPSRSRTSDHAHGTTRHFISRTSISFSPTQMYTMHLTLPL